jgi:hypothetical protein
MESIRKKADKVVELVQDKNLGTNKAIELVRNCKMDNNGELYNPDTGKTFKNVEDLTDVELREFLKSV